MKINLKRFKSVFLATIVASLLLGVTGCGKGDFAVRSFEAEKDTYSPGEQIVFNIGVNNPNKYKLIGATIDDQFYKAEDSLSTNRMKITGITHTEAKLSYVLSSVRYIKEDGKEYDFKYSKTAIVSNPTIVRSDITVESFDVVPYIPNGVHNLDTISDTLYFNSKATAIIRLKKKPGVLVNNFQFNVDGKALSINARDSESQFEYKIDFDLSNEGESVPKKNVKFELLRINYTKNTRFRSYDKALSVVKEVLTQAMELKSFKVENIENAGTDINGISYIDKNALVHINIELTNRAAVYPRGIVISGQLIKLNIDDVTINAPAKRVKIETDVRLKTINTSEDAEIKLEGILYDTDNNAKTMSLSKTLRSNVRCYDKVIMNQNDLKDLEIQGDTIVGSYILGNSINVTRTDTYLFNRIKKYKFGGYFNGNGYSINAKLDYHLFNSIEERATVENLKLISTNDKASLLCDVNNGTLNNIILEGELGLKKQDDQDVRNIICNTNNGEITNIDIRTNLTGSQATFSLVDTNKGKISKINFDPYSVSLGRNKFFIAPAINDGEFSNIFVGVSKWYDNISATTAAQHVNNANFLVANVNKETVRSILLNQDIRNATANLNRALLGAELNTKDIIVAQNNKYKQFMMQLQNGLKPGALVNNIFNLVTLSQKLDGVYKDAAVMIHPTTGKPTVIYPYVIVIPTAEEGREQLVDLDRASVDGRNPQAILSRLSMRVYDKDFYGRGNNEFWNVKNKNLTLDFEDARKQNYPVH